MTEVMSVHWKTSGVGIHCNISEKEGIYERNRRVEKSSNTR